MSTRPEGMAPPASPRRRARRRPRGVALPLATAAAVALSAASVPLARRARRHLPAPVADLLVTGALAGAGWSLLAVLERVDPAHPDWNVEGDAEMRADLQHVAVGLVPNAVTAKLAATAADALLAGGPDRRSPWPARAPLPVRVALALALTELIHYGHHRAAHSVPLLWRAHSVHHSETRLYWMNGTRFHPLDEVPLVGLQVLALRLVGVDDDAVVAHNVLKLVHGLLQHANLAGTCGPVQRVMSTAEQHRLHHAPSRPAEAVNFGAVLSVWDTLFGTGRRPDGPTPAAAPTIGLVDMPAFPESFVGQLLAPFHWADATAAPAPVGAA